MLDPDYHNWPGLGLAGDPFRAKPVDCIGLPPEERIALMSNLNAKFTAWFETLAAEEKESWRAEYRKQKAWPEPWWKNLRAEVRPNCEKESQSSRSGDIDEINGVENIRYEE